MKEQKIKPIPKYIINRIRKMDMERHPAQDGNLRYYSYLTKNDGELVKVTVAVKNRYKKHWHYKQVAVHGLNSERCFVKDMAFYYISGYVVGWFEEGLTKRPNWYEGPSWGWSNDQYFDPYAPIVNKEYLAKFEEFKYAAWEQFTHDKLFKYLRLYRVYPQLEYLTKLGLQNYYDKTMILKKLNKDKKFRKWIGRNREELQRQQYDVNTIFKAFRTNKSLPEIQRFNDAKKSLRGKDNYNRLKELFQNDMEQLFTYIAVQKTSVSNYNDYLSACLEMNIDMSIPKNRYPHNFQHWHDIRIDEYRSVKAKLDEKKRKELYEKFYSVAEKYVSLQRDKEAFVVIIAKSPAELIREGEILHHCVGRMGYDQKFVREETLIFFVRDKNAVDTPFVTMEYSLSTHKILQCYAVHNQKPSENVLTFVNKKWLPYANRQLKKLVA